MKWIVPAIALLTPSELLAQPNTERIIKRDAFQHCGIVPSDEVVRSVIGGIRSRQAKGERNILNNLGLQACALTRKRRTPSSAER